MLACSGLKEGEGQGMSEEEERPMLKRSPGLLRPLRESSKEPEACMLASEKMR